MAQLTNVLSSRYIYFNSKKFNYISLLSSGWLMVSMVRRDKGQIGTYSAQFDILIEILSRSQCWHLWVVWGHAGDPCLAPPPHWTLELINQIFLICLCCNLLTRTSPLSRLNTPIRWPAPAPGHWARLKINCQQFCFHIMEGWMPIIHNPVI